MFVSLTSSLKMPAPFFTLSAPFAPILGFSIYILSMLSYHICIWDSHHHHQKHIKSTIISTIFQSQRQTPILMMFFQPSATNHNITEIHKKTTHTICWFMYICCRYVYMCVESMFIHNYYERNRNERENLPTKYF